MVYVMADAKVAAVVVGKDVLRVLHLLAVDLKKRTTSRRDDITAPFAFLILPHPSRSHHDPPAGAHLPAEAARVAESLMRATEIEPVGHARHDLEPGHLLLQLVLLPGHVEEGALGDGRGRGRGRAVALHVLGPRLGCHLRHLAHRGVLSAGRVAARVSPLQS